MKTFTAIILLAFLTACATPRYTREILWPADPAKNQPSILVVEWPKGVPATAIVVMDATDALTSETRAQSAAPYTPPVDPTSAP